MHELVEEVVSFLAYEGPGGVPLDVLWEYVHRRHFSELPATPPAIKQSLWAHLLAAPSTFGVFCSKCHAGVTESMATPVDGELSLYPAGNPMCVTGFKITDLDAFRDLSHERLKDVFVMLAQRLRFMALGVRVAQLQDKQASNLNSTALATLEAIAKGREAGGIASELSRQVGVKPTNFFYVLSKLLERDLIVKVPVRATTATSKTVIQTSLLCLKSLAKDAGKGRTDIVSQGDDDSKLLVEITAKMATLPDGTVLEAELKQFFGFTHTAGHRAWKRVKTKLLKGYIEEFEGKVADTTARMLKLLQPYTIGAATDAGDDGAGSDVYETVLPQGVPLDRALLELLVRAGDKGLSTEEVLAVLPIHTKYLNKTMQQLSLTHGVTAEKEMGVKSKRARINRYTCPAKVADPYRPLLAFQHPDLNFAPSLAHLPPVPGVGQAMPPSHSADHAHGPPGQPEPNPVTAAVTGDATHAAAPAPAPQTPPAQSTEAGAADTAAASQRAVQASRGASLAVARDARSRTLREHMQVHGFLIQPEIRYVWYLAKKRDPTLPAILDKIDQKGTKRLIDVMKANNDIASTIHVMVPVAKSKQALTHSKKMAVHLPPDKVWDHAQLCRLAIERNTEISKAVRSQDYFRALVDLDQPDQSLPDVSEHIGCLVPSAVEHVAELKKGDKEDWAAIAGGSGRLATIEEHADLSQEDLPTPNGGNEPEGSLLQKRKRAERAEATRKLPRHLSRLFRLGPRDHVTNWSRNELLPSRAHRLRVLHAHLCEVTWPYPEAQPDVLQRASATSLPPSFMQCAAVGLSPQDGAELCRHADGRPVLTSTLAFLSMNVRSALLACGTSRHLSDEGTEKHLADMRRLYELSNAELLEIFEPHVVARYVELLRNLFALRLLEQYPPRAGGTIDHDASTYAADSDDSASAFGWHFLVHDKAIVQMPVSGLDAARDNLVVQAEAMAAPHSAQSAIARATPAPMLGLSTSLVDFGDGVLPYSLRAVQNQDARSEREVVYDMSMWQGYMLFWNHVVSIRESVHLVKAYSALAPFRFAPDIIQLKHRARAAMKKLSQTVLDQFPASEAGSPACLRAASRVGLALQELKRFAEMETTAQKAPPKRLGTIKSNTGPKPAGPKAAGKSAKASGRSAAQTRVQSRPAPASEADDDDDGDDHEDDITAPRTEPDTDAGAAPPPLKRRRRVQPPKRKVRDTKMHCDDQGAHYVNIYSSDDPCDPPGLVLRKRNLRQARRKALAFVGIVPTGESCKTRAERRSAGFRLLRAAGLLEGYDSDSDDDSDDNDAQQQAQGEATKKVVKRWSIEQDTALIVAEMRLLALAGKNFERTLVPISKVAPGACHTTSACLRRINFYRQSKHGRELYWNAHKLSATVYAARVESQREALVALVDECLAEASRGIVRHSDDAGAAAVRTGPRSAAVAELVGMLHPDLSSELPHDRLAAIVAPDALAELPRDSFFLPRSADEEKRHEDITGEVLSFVQAIPVGRPAAPKAGAASRLHKAARPEIEESLQLVSQITRTRETKRPEARLSNEIRSALRSAGAGNVSAAVDITAAAGSMTWREATCVHALLGLAVAWHAGTPVAKGAKHVLGGFSEEVITGAIAALRGGRVVLPDEKSPLRMVVTRQCRAVIDSIASLAAPLEAVVAAAQRFLVVPGVAGAAGDPALTEDTATVAGAGVAGVNIAGDERPPAGLLMHALCGLSCNRVSISLLITLSDLAQGDLTALDQFGEARSVVVQLSHTAPPEPAQSDASHSGPAGRRAAALACEAAGLPALYRERSADKHGALPPWLTSTSADASCAPDLVARLHASARTRTAQLLAVPSEMPSDAQSENLPRDQDVEQAVTLLGSTLSDVTGAAGATGVLVVSVLKQLCAEERHRAALETIARALAVPTLRGGVRRDVILLEDGGLLSDEVAHSSDLQGAHKDAVLLLPALQTVVAALVARGEVDIRPTLSQYVLVSPGAHDERSEKQPARTRSGATVYQPAWRGMDGTVNLPMLRVLAWQVKCLLARYPGAPECALLGRLKHVIGPTHGRELLRHMEAAGDVCSLRTVDTVRCHTRAVQAVTSEEAHAPPWLEQMAQKRAELVEMAGGLVPSIFGCPTEPVAARVTVHYMCNPEATLTTLVSEHALESY